MKLEIELVPKTAWGNNVRDRLTQSQWDKVRRKSYAEANHTCEICGGKGGNGKKHPVECHEIWEFDNINHRIILKGLISLCPPCHEVKHIGRAEANGTAHRALNHFMRVNGMNKQNAIAYMNKVAREYHSKSRISDWTLDISYLIEYMGQDFYDKIKHKV